ncbi:2-dehydropantoate 2-reductase [Bacillus sp. AFS041924]|jgi:2-dehydropantoate 2-reductase|uniref:2-dehydropantoate 2-reductase n=1 Tax=Bacillus sp. AFS041924 TaxID=2033503 RepID=UPI000BFDCAF4|nr:2-dehydropantoate 2-reductase [Bacillus sp. AFS041924]PGS52558.1 2-dehydropantoate 2-reductase [Bacillus sp. AFS041924]
MRILVLGAGGVGGYFGGRLVEKGEDVTFLVRANRKKQLEENGLVIHSVHGDYSFQPNLITAESSAEVFDIVLFSTKSYHLNNAINDVKPFVGDQTVIIPLLNGIAHLNPLKQAFGEEQVIGGLCFIETTLNENGEVVQTSKAARLVFGEFHSKETERIKRIANAFNGSKADFVHSNQIERDMWHKYLFITVMSGVTSLIRVPIGPIRESDGGSAIIRELFEECANIMRAYGAPISENIVDEHMKSIDALGYKMKSSLQRDMEKGSLVEGDHLQGYLLELAEKKAITAKLLKLVYQNIKVYQKMQQDHRNEKSERLSV